MTALRLHLTEDLNRLNARLSSSPSQKSACRANNNPTRFKVASNAEPELRIDGRSKPNVGCWRRRKGLEGFLLVRMRSGSSQSMEARSPEHHSAAGWAVRQKPLTSGRYLCNLAAISRGELFPIPFFFIPCVTMHLPPPDSSSDIGRYLCRACFDIHFVAGRLKSLYCSAGKPSAARVVHG